jgi:alpha-beta hydrolase superfamily lysophospholipase
MSSSGPTPLALIAAALYFASGPAVLARETRVLDRADGSQITFHLDRKAGKGRQSAILLMQGSGCDPVASNARVTSVAPLVAPGDAVITIEKYGVASGEGQAGLVDGCSRNYWAGNTLQQRVIDAAQVVSQLRREKWWNRRLIIFGGSEGGAVAAMLAPLVPETKAVIIYSSGIGVPVGELIRAAVPSPVAAEAPKIFAEAKANPTGERRWAGASYRWWADAVGITPARMLLQTTAPILLIHGTRDQSAPVATARATRDLLVRHGKANLTYREYEGYDHFMRDAAGADHRPSVLKDAAAWLRRNVPE